MLQELRGKTQSVFAYVIIGLLILSFGLWGVSSYFGGGGQSVVIAKVSGQKITISSLSQAYQNYVRNQEMQMGAAFMPTPEQKVGLQQQVLQSMITNIVILNYFSKNGYGISNDQVGEAIFQLPVFQDQGAFSATKYRQYLAGSNQTDDTFVSKFKEQLLFGQLEAGLNSSEFSLPYQVENTIALMGQKRKVRYTYILPSENKVTVDSKKINQYYQSHESSFEIPEQVQVEYIEVSLSQLAKNVTASSDDLKKYYQQNKSRFMQVQQWQVIPVKVSYSDANKEAKQKVITAINEALNTGKELKDVKMTDGLEQGDSQWLSADKLSSSQFDSLSGTKNKGKASKVEDSGTSFEFYYVTDYKPSVQQSYQQVASDVKSAYTNSVATKQYQNIVDQLTNISYEQPDSLAPAAKATGLAIQTSGYFPKIGEKEGLASNSNVVRAAFADDVLIGGNNSDIIALKNNTSVVLRVKEHKESTKKPLSEVSDSIRDKVIAQENDLATLKSAQAVKNALLKKQSVSSIQSQYGITFDTTDYLGRFSKDLDTNIMTMIFMQPYIKDQPMVSANKLPDGRFVVMEVLSIKPGIQADATDKERETYQSEEINSYSHLEFNMMKNSLLSKSKSTINQKALSPDN